jgi:hypothetical protein
VLRLKLVLRGGLDVVDVAAVARLDLVDGDPGRIRRPGEALGIVVAALGSVGAEDGEVTAAGFADGDVVVPDHRLPLAVGRLHRLGRVDVELTPDGARQAPAAPAATARVALVQPAGVVTERAAPRRLADHELDRLLVVGERERVERQLERRVLALGCRRQRGRQLRVIEGRLPGRGIGVYEDELVPALDALPVGEAVGRLDEPRRLGHVEGQAAVAVPEPHGAAVVLDPPLRGRRRRQQDGTQGDQARRLEAHRHARGF